jgi:hypothetical protein
MRSRKKILQDGLWDLDVIVEGRSLADHNKLRKAEITSDLERTILLEEVSWRKQSRALWLREEDKKIKSSTVSLIQTKGTTLLNHLLLMARFLQILQELKSIFCSFTLIIIQCNSIGDLNWMVFLLILLVLRRLLGWKVFEESEVCEVVKALNGDKAPSPDGFSLPFI